ncbi:hypothetical protein G7075_20075 [Phycicoccus sp. HDW14]|uniref:hypothetical protein n=1 Tax=Phycicoccus sp. HDW14 TaxID=2714941 RepID=UPI00140C4F78|nr:hypothetical protein [Phycicoccus sp. HDW14]QIM22892.1 hypothetical protein G7075_20075 [Phycicoccus sp. HDW14]
MTWSPIDSPWFVFVMLSVVAVAVAVTSVVGALGFLTSTAKRRRAGRRAARQP